MTTFVDHIRSLAFINQNNPLAHIPTTTYVPAAACSRVVVAARHWPCGTTKARAAPEPVSSAATSTAARGAICFFGGLWVGAGRDVSNPDGYDLRLILC